MKILLASYLIAIPLTVILLVTVLIRSFRSLSLSWRERATQVALGVALVSGLTLCGYLVCLFLWNDESAAVGSLIGIRMLVKWGHWGVWLAAAGFLFALPARAWGRIISIFASVLFASFWIVAYTIF